MRHIILSVFLVLIATANSVVAEVPPLINYQGTLTGYEGELLGATGMSTHRLEFNIYGDPAGTNHIWGPQVFPAVPVVNGYFNVILGPTETHPDGTAIANGKSIVDAFRSGDRYIGVKVDDSTNEILPRQQVLGAPFALSAGSLAGGIFPVGSLLYSLLDEVDFQNRMGVEWVLLDGRAIDQTDELSDYLVASPDEDGKVPLPDGQGKFLRMMDYRSNQDNREFDGDPQVGRHIGHFQKDSIQGHVHSHTGYANSGQNAWPYGFAFAGYNQVSNAQTRGPQADGDLYGSLQVTSENRPRNIAVNLFVKIRECQSARCR